MTHVSLNDEQILALASQIKAEETTRQVIETLRQFYGSQVMAAEIISYEYYNDEEDVPGIGSMTVFDAQGQELPYDRSAPGWAKALRVPQSYIREYPKDRLRYELHDYLLRLKSFPLATDGLDTSIKTRYDLAAIGTGRMFTDIQGVAAAPETLRPPLAQEPARHPDYDDDEEEDEDEDEDEGEKHEEEPIDLIETIAQMVVDKGKEEEKENLENAPADHCSGQWPCSGHKTALEAMFAHLDQLGSLDDRYSDESEFPEDEYSDES